MNTSILGKLNINKGSPQGIEISKVLLICRRYSVKISITHFDTLLVLIRKTPYATFKGEVVIKTLKAHNFNPLHKMSRVILNNGLVLPLEVFTRNPNKSIEVELKSRIQILSPVYCINMGMNYTELLVLLCSYIFNEDVINIKVRHGVTNTNEIITLIQTGILKNMSVKEHPNSIFVSMYIFTKNHLNFSKGDVLIGNASNTVNDLYALPNTPLRLDNLKRDIAVLNKKDLKHPLKNMVLNPFNVLLIDDEELNNELEIVNECDRLCDVCSNSLKKKCSVRENMDLYIRMLLNIKSWKKKLQ